MSEEIAVEEKPCSNLPPLITDRNVQLKWVQELKTTEGKNFRGKISKETLIKKLPAFKRMIEWSEWKMVSKKLPDEQEALFAGEVATKTVYYDLQRIPTTLRQFVRFCLKAFDPEPITIDMFLEKDIVNGFLNFYELFTKRGSSRRNVILCFRRIIRYLLEFKCVFESQLFKAKQVLSLLRDRCSLATDLKKQQRTSKTALEMMRTGQMMEVMEEITFYIVALKKMIDIVLKYKVDDTTCEEVEYEDALEFKRYLFCLHVLWDGGHRRQVYAAFRIDRFVDNEFGWGFIPGSEKVLREIPEGMCIPLPLCLRAPTLWYIAHCWPVLVKVSKRNIYKALWIDEYGK